MHNTAKITFITCIVVIATAIVFGSVGCKSNSPTPTPTPQSSVVATSTPTSEPTVIINPTETPDETTTPTATPESTQTGTTNSTPTPEPSVTANATTTATSTSTPTASATPTKTPTPTKTTAPTATPAHTPTPTPTHTPTTTTTPTPTPTPSSTLCQGQTNVSINSATQLKNNSTVTIDVNINNVAYMALAGFDLQFNSSCINYNSCNPASQIGSGSSNSIYADIIHPGLLRVTVDYTGYAGTNGGNGVTGSGYLCKLYFTAIAQGTTKLEFVKGQGNPTGELTLLKWVAYNPSEIESVCWTNSSNITVVNN